MYSHKDLVSAFVKILFLILFVCCYSCLNSQITISGRVVHSGTKEPMPGVDIHIKNTSLGTSTDLYGFFEITVSLETAIMEVTHVGMIPQEIRIVAQRVFAIELEPDVLWVDGVVVTAIGIPKEKKELGYSVQEMSGNELIGIKNDNLLNSLSGRVAGLQVTGSSGSAGSSSFITIRGATSLTGNNQPLFVVDGIPVSNNNGGFVANGVDLSNRLIDLNSDDIESVSVLKGGAATALYGIRASAGAVLITTKKGKATPPDAVHVTFRTSVTFDKVSSLPEMQQRYGQGVYGVWVSGFPASWGPRLDTCSYTRDLAYWSYPPFDVDGAIVGVSDPAATGEAVRVYDARDFFQTAVSYVNAIDLSGGSETSSFYTSASYTHTEGVVPGSTWSRFTMRLTGETRIGERFRLTGNANYIHSGGDRKQRGNNASGIMLGLLRTPPTFDDAAGYELADGSQRNYQHGGGYDNPYWSVNKNIFTDRIDRLIGYAGFDWDIATWVNLSYRLGLDYFSDTWKNHFAVGSCAYPSGFVWVDKYDEHNINSDLIATFRYEPARNWQLEARLGHHLSEIDSHELWSTATGLSMPDFYHLTNTSAQFTSDLTQKVRRAAFFGEIETICKRMVYLTLTGRNDWSTTLPESNNSFFYPSVSVAWVFTELKPLVRNRILPFGKIRFSYAITASDAEPYRTRTNFAPAAVIDRWTGGLQFPLMGYAGFTLSDIMGNDHLMPEKTSGWELGADMRFFENKLSFDFSYFRSYSRDLLLSVPVAGSTGFQSLYRNIGEMSSHGMEFMVGATPLRTTCWSWDLSLNLSRVRNTVEKLAPNVEFLVLGFEGVVSGAREGYPYQSILGYDWLRDDDGNVIINDDPESPHYGFPVGNFDTVVYGGHVNPDWLLGWNNEVRWKNLSLAFLLEIKKGGVLWNGTRGAMYYFGTHGDQQYREPDDLVVIEGVKQSNGSPNDIRVIQGMNWYALGQGSTFTGPDIPYVEDAGWIRLREVGLHYRLDRTQLGDGFFRMIEFSVSGRNLWLSTKYKGIDPETSLFGAGNAQGFDYFNMPGTKGVTVGVRVEF